MRNYGTIILVVVVAIVGIIYIGGAVNVAGKPIFEHIDSALGTSFFMGCYYTLGYSFRRSEGPERDEWTKTHQDFKKVLKNTVE